MRTLKNNISVLSPTVLTVAISSEWSFISPFSSPFVNHLHPKNLSPFISSHQEPSLVLRTALASSQWPGPRGWPQVPIPSVLVTHSQGHHLQLFNIQGTSPAINGDSWDSTKGNSSSSWEISQSCSTVQQGLQQDTAFTIPNICTEENCDQNTPPLLLAHYASMAPRPFWFLHVFFFILKCRRPTEHHQQ